MKDQVKVIIVEGDGNHVVQVLTSLGYSGGGEAHTEAEATTASMSSAAVDSGEKFVTAEVAYQVLTRIELSKPMKDALAKLAQAYPDQVSASDLYKVTGYDGMRFAGLMGAFGRRIANTPGYDGESYFFDEEWDHERQVRLYRLPESVMEALRKFGLI